jgi:hypothetical protein
MDEFLVQAPRPVAADPIERRSIFPGQVGTASYSASHVYEHRRSSTSSVGSAAHVHIVYAEQIAAYLAPVDIEEWRRQKFIASPGRCINHIIRSLIWNQAERQQRAGCRRITWVILFIARNEP